MFFSDDELTALLDMYDDNAKLTAARCMETIAGSQALLLKAWSSDDLTVNGDRIAKELRELAKQLRSEAIANESSDSFNIIPFPVTELETWWN
jgi:2-polyprenyl-6-methoxyphenol hydroxylase-like FAD-dependent oxidoreductase